MDIRFAAPSETSTSENAALCWLVTRDTLGQLDTGLNENADILAAAKATRFKGNAGETFQTFVTRNGEGTRVVLVGTSPVGGADKGLELERAGGSLVARYLTSGVETIAIDCGQASLDAAGLAQFLLGARLRAWRHDRYRTRLSETAKPSLKALAVSGAPDGADAAWATSAAIADGVEFTRELISEPANIVYPESFVERCQHLADLGVKISTLDTEQMAALGMGALLGVAQGSSSPPRLLVMEWNGGGNAKPLLLVGKGVTFDSGGISIKPAAGMEDMKWDMGGAGTVAGTMKAIASRKAKANVVAICGLVENMPDGNAQRPGDVVTSFSGQTIEVINTDAEGRLVLCDALSWGQKEFKPDTVIDLATLTGAIIISLGDQHAGLFTNSDELSVKLLDAGTKAGDPLWRFPLSKAYDKQLDSQIADMKNVGGRGAGSITAAQFLQRFIDEGVNWAHLDIAGMVWTGKAGRTWDKGATGYGVRLLDRFIADNFED